MTITNGKNAQKKSAPSVEPERVSDGGGTIYGPDSHPPLQTLVVNAVQHTGVILFNMLSVVGVLAVCGLSETAVRDQVAWVLISLAIISILMTYRRGPIGAGLLLTVIPSSVFLSPALAAAREGGLPLVAGMIIFSGVLVVILTPLIPRLRPYFSAEIAGIVVLIIGIDLSAKSLSYILDKGGANSSFGYYSYAISFASLATTIVISVWIGGALSNYAILLGLLAGVIAWFAVSAATGVPMPNFSESAILSLPQLKWEGLSFQTDLMLAYGVATFAFVLTTMGTITNAQKLANPKWVRPNMRSILGGSFSAGLGLIIGGFFGNYGSSISSSSIGLAQATGVLSLRVVGVVASLLLFAALSPLLVDLVLSIPLGIVGGLWLILGAFVIIAGVQMLASRILDVRKSLVIGLSIPIGMSAAIYPEVFAVFPEFLQPLTNSTLALGTTTAMFLNAIFRIGIKQSAEISIARTDDPGTRIEAFLRRQGGLWAARSFVIDKAIFSLAQVVELIHDCRGDSDDIRVLAEFDEYNLRLSITHSGEPLDFPRRRPTPKEIVTHESGTDLLAGYLVRSGADTLDVLTSDGTATIKIRFDH